MVDTTGRFQPYPGRTKIDFVLIEKSEGSTDITNLFVEFNIYASIVDPTAIGKVSLMDATNLLSNLPIETGDVLKVGISFYDIKKEYRFRISSIEDIANFDHQKAYTLTCVSELAYASYHNKISRSFSGLTSDIAKSIYDQYTFEEIGLWDNSISHQNVVIPNWSPMRTLMWLAERSEANFDHVRFKFYQDTNLRYNFMPIEQAVQLYRDSPPITYTYNKNANYIRKADESIPNSKAVNEAILSLEFANSFNLAETLKSGRLTGRVHAIDINKKQMSTTNYNYWQDFNSKQHLNEMPQWRYDEYQPGKIDIHHEPTDTTSFGGTNNRSDYSHMKETIVDNTQKINIVVGGNSVVDIGQVVNIVIPSAEPLSDSMRGKEDLRWSGKYFVIAKRDMFDKTGMQIALTLAKDSRQVGG